MRRREFITLLGGAAVAWPVVARAQQSAMPVVGFLHILPPEDVPAAWLAGFRQGLKEAGFVQGQNVAIEFRWANGHPERLPGLAAELVDRKVAAIFAAGGNNPAKAAKAATTTTPIVFLTGGDPVKAGIIASLNRPGGNLTGVSLLGTELEAKRFGLLNEIVPGTATIGVLVNSIFPDANLQVRALQEAADATKRKISIVQINSEAEIDSAIAAFAQQGVAALQIAQAPFFTGRREQIVALAARYRLPAVYPHRGFTSIGGLLSYGTDFADSFRQAGAYVGKILKGSGLATCRSRSRPSSSSSSTSRPPRHLASRCHRNSLPVPTR